MKANLEIEVGTEKGFKVVKFTGEFDKAGFSEVKDKLNEIVKNLEEKELVFDFSGLNFINSEGIGYLMEAHSHLVKGGKKLVILKPKDNVKDVFKAIGIQEVVPIQNEL